MGIPVTRDVVIASITDLRMVNKDTHVGSPALIISLAIGYHDPDSISMLTGTPNFVETAPRVEGITIPWAWLIEWAQSTQVDLMALDTMRITPVYQFIEYLVARGQIKI